MRPASSVPASALPGASNRVRVIVTLEDPPLAAASYARRLPGLGSNARLDVSSRFSRSYLETLEVAQTRAIASLHKAIPEARVSRRYRVLVNGFAASVPYARLPTLLDADFAERVYPSYSYRLKLNRGPEVLGAPHSPGSREHGARASRSRSWTTVSTTSIPS